MPNSGRRKQLETDLDSWLRKAETDAYADPQIKAMIQQIRQLYLVNKDDFMFMLGMAAPPAPKQPRRLPESKIPQLLSVLDQLGKLQPFPRPPLRNVPLRASRERPSNSLPQGGVSSSPDTAITPVATIPATRNVQDREKQLAAIDAEILAAKVLFEKVKQEEDLIRSRKGKYGIAVERLKAERLLRELPQKIAELAYQRRMVEEGSL